MTVKGRINHYNVKFLGVMVFLVVAVVDVCKEITFTSWEKKDGAENIINNIRRIKNIILFASFWYSPIIYHDPSTFGNYNNFIVD